MSPRIKLLIRMFNFFLLLTERGVK